MKWPSLFMNINSNYIKVMLAAAIMTLSPSLEGMAIPSASEQQTTSKGRRQESGKKGNAAAAKKRGAKSAAKGNPGRSKETSADVRKRQEATQKEIKLAKEQIAENERSIKRGLNELGKLETDITTSQAKIKTTTEQIAEMTGRIGTLENGIKGNEKELQRLRTEYLKAVKKMRLARRNNSELAFIFASKSFNQALRRMRYLRQFSEWKDRQSAVIAGKTTELKSQKEELAESKRRQDAMLSRQRAEESTLKEQHAKQDAIVAGLRKNGDALKTHLSKKQAEANQLRNRIAQLIAAEEEARRAKEEQERKAAEEKARREEERRLAREAEEKAAREAELLAQSERKAEQEKEAKKREEDEKQKADKDSDKKDSKKEQQKKDEQKKKEKQKKSDKKKSDKGKSSDVNYADARKRTPRGVAKTSGDKKGIASAAKSSAAAGNFAGMKGSLPRPASGSFKVTSRFGRQSLPDLPDVVYDNPGIDAEVSSGASALAVYGGKVSGVYVLPGYNTVVIVNHGNYYTVYGNISSPAVKVGDQVRAGQGLGRLAPDEDNSGSSSIHFEVWKNREKLNPLDWIR